MYRGLGHFMWWLLPIGYMSKKELVHGNHHQYPVNVKETVHMKLSYKVQSCNITIMSAFIFIYKQKNQNQRCSRSRDHMVDGFTTTYAISAYHHWCCGFKSRSGWGIQHYVIKFVSDLWQVGGFLWVLRFPQPIKLTATISLKYCWKWH